MRLLVEPWFAKKRTAPDTNPEPSAPEPPQVAAASATDSAGATTLLAKKFGFEFLLRWVSLLALVHVSLEDSILTRGSCVHVLLEDTLEKSNLET